jgi:hypothetical protein
MPQIYKCSKKYCSPRTYKISRGDIMKRKIVALITATLLAFPLFTTGCGKSGDSAQKDAASSAETESEDAESKDSDSDITEDESEEEEITNTDVTAGTTDDDGMYSCDAILNDGMVTVAVAANASDIKEQDASKADPIAQQGDDDLRDTRIAYLMSYFEEDEDNAETDYEENYTASAPSDEEIEEIMNYADELGRIFKQFGIVSYDLTMPAVYSEDYIEYDVYSEDGKLFYADFTFDNGELTNIDFYQDEF